VQFEALRIAKAHSRLLLSLHDEQQQNQQQQQQQQGGTTMAPARTSGGQIMDGAAIARTVVGYICAVEDSLYLTTCLTYEGYALGDMALQAIKGIPHALVAEHADLIPNVVLPSVEKLRDYDGDKRVAGRLSTVLDYIKASDFFPAHAGAMRVMLDAGAKEQQKQKEHKDLLGTLVGLLEMYAEGGGSLDFLARDVGHLIGAMAPGRGAKGTAQTDKAVLRLLNAIPAGAFGPAPVDEAEAGTGGGGGSEVPAGPSVALEGLLELLRSTERGGLTPNPGRTQALQALPLDRIFKPHIAKVFDSLDILRKAGKRAWGDGKAAARALLDAGYDTVAQFPLAWTLPHLLDLCTDRRYEEEESLGQAVLGTRQRMEGEATVARLVDAQAEELLGKIEDHGPATIDVSSYRYDLLKLVLRYVSKERLRVFEEQANVMVNCDASSA
jgi:hypothetical protein